MDGVADGYELAELNEKRCGRKRKCDKEQVLLALCERLLKGYPPTIAELQADLGVGSSRTVLRYLRELEQDGRIERWRGARGLRLSVATEKELISDATHRAIQCERQGILMLIAHLLDALPSNGTAYRQLDSLRGMIQRGDYKRYVEIAEMQMRKDAR